MFLEVRRWIESTSAPALLDSLLGRESPARALLGDLLGDHLGDHPRLDHLGLLLPPASEGLFRAAAAATGFDESSPCFASTHVARELGMLAGVPLVPTVVAKQARVVGAGRRFAIEAFIPDVDPALAERWIADDVGRHFAVEMDDAQAFARVVRELPALGLPMPPFLDGPSHVDAEATTIAYFELGPLAPVPRLEVRIRDHGAS